MSQSEFQFSNQFVQLYCHGIQLRCDDLHEILKTANVDIRRRVQNDCFELYEMKSVDQIIAAQFENYHLLMFNDSPSHTSLKSLATTLTQASTVYDVLIRLSDFLGANESPVELRLNSTGEYTEVSLSLDNAQNDISLDHVQFLTVLRLFKIIRIINQLAQSNIPIYAFKAKGEVSDLTKPYIKLHQPEFIYHRQKRNAFVIPTSCLSLKCKTSLTDFADFLRQHADILFSLKTGTKLCHPSIPELNLEQQNDLQPEKPQQEVRHSLTLKEIQERIINEKTVDLMMNTSVPASEIGRRLGLTNSTRFSRSFKEMNKVKPGEFYKGKMIRLN